ncbi:MAG TPA: proton-conducting transporter membrane subunit, partial [Elusimicrobiales bacterium]|nr:proton-conducting transporter membrane subunit [Elusimicrobiales bacterium]
MSYLLFLILAPAMAAGAALLLEHAAPWLKAALSTAVSLACFAVGVHLFGQTVALSVPWGGFGFDFSLRLYHLSGFLVCAVSGFALLVSLYSWVFMQDKPHTGWYYFNFLLTLSFANGAVLADNLVLMLFFWEGMMIPLYLFIAFSYDTHESRATAMKALLISGAADLCLLVGVGITSYLAETTSISAICSLQ